MSALQTVAGIDRRLAQAADAQLAQVVALVDGMANRGAADALIQPLRGRLAELAPARPITLARLLFKPLDPVIVPEPGWQPGNATVPRQALGAIGTALLGRLSGVTARLQPLIAGQTWDNLPCVAEAGAALWPAAAALLPTLPPPPEWSQTGLSAECFQALRSTLTAVLEHGAMLEAWPRETEAEGNAALIRTTLSAAQARHPAQVATILALLLANGALAGPVLAVASTLPGTATDAAVEQALTRTERTLQSSLPALALGAACEQAVQVFALLESLDQPTSQPKVRAHAQRTRTLADQACRGRMLQALDRHILPALTADAPADGPALEAAARDVRRLALIGRRCGTQSVYDKLLGRTAAGICAAPNPALSHMDRLRLAELLVGAEAAMALMEPG